MNESNKQHKATSESFGCSGMAVVFVILTILMICAYWSFMDVRGPHPVHYLKVEIDQLSGALSDFKSKFGLYPPSRITIYEKASGWKQDERSQGFVERMWPEFDFGRDRDLNNDGRLQSFRLTGAECLIFFLGGIRRNGELDGFASDAADPFSSEGVSRIGPFIEFDSERFVDVDRDGFVEYLDPLRGQAAPYLYASSYDGAGYEAADLDVFGPGDSLNMRDVYRQSGSDQKPWNVKTFQIISSGFDNAYGIGGTFDVDSAEKELVNIPGRVQRAAERDNITNFHSGLLAP